MPVDTIYINETTKAVFHIAGAFAKENYNESFGAPHLLRALLHKESGLESFLEATGKDIAYLREWAEIRIEDYPKTAQLPESPAPDAIVNTLLEVADDIRLKFGFDEVSALCLLAAIVKPGIAFSVGQLKSLPLREADFNHLFHFSPSTSNGTDALETGITSNREPQMDIITKYCIDKTQQARQEKLDPIIGRDRETRQMIEILGRRSKPNVIIAGDPGVGKSALIDGFAQAIVKGDVPEHLLQAILYELNLGALMAGASYKGEVEDRVKKIIGALKQFDKAVLFVDEMHVLLDAKGPMGSGVGNLLKPELARGEITVIGATTMDEYRKIIEPEQAFNRRFELLQITEPDIKSAEKMVALLAPKYEAHHQLEIEKDAIPECVRFAKRYIKDKRLPDAAIDLLDQTLAAMRLAKETSAKELEKAEQALSLIREQNTTTEEATLLAELAWFHRTLEQKLSPILIGALTDETEVAKIATAADMNTYLDRMLAQLKKIAQQEKRAVTALDIAAMVAAKTKIPIGKIQTQEREKLINMEAHLKRRMVGQEQALKSISEAIVESRSGINKPGQPIGSFFLLGPTGTGKTELAKSIAELLFNDEKAMIRFDMSEFKEEHAAALLYGAPPGYVGYEEGGMLVNKIRQQPYSVVLFDEIEKAHQSIFDVFLQIMDEGHIHDKLGKEGDFSNALILFTSNIGSDFIIERFQQQHIPTSNELMERMTGKFRPEFLARLTEIIPFGPITEDMATQIFNIQMGALLDILKKKNIELTIAPETQKMLALKGFEPKYGARQIAGTIRQRIRRPVSRMIVAGEIAAGDKIEVQHNEKDDLVWKK